MTDHIKEIDNIIQKAALDGVLTSGAVKQFNELILERDALLKTTEEQKKEIEKRTAAEAELTKRLNIHIEQGQTLMTREAAVEETENEHRDRLVMLKCANLRVDDHKEMFSVVFRNSVLRKEVMTRNDSHTESSGASHSSFENKDTLEEEEK